MKTCLTLIIFILAGQFVFCSTDPGNEINCKSVKTGKFKLVGKGREYLIERDKKIQIETDLESNATAKFKVTWVSECEYELNMLEGREDLMNFYKGKTLSIRIVETSENGYKFEGKMKGTEMNVVVYTVERVN